MAQSSAQLKLGWGIKRLEPLCWETLTYQHSDAYVPRVERDVRSPQEIKYEVFATENIAPSDDWPLMAGEVIQSFRAALDHAVYGLISSKKYRGSSQFPIFIDPCGFQVKGRPRIKGVPKPVRALIEEAQPYKHTPSWPSIDALAVLSKLSNADKHRQLFTVASGVEFTSIGTNSHIAIDWHEPFAADPLKHDAKVTSFTATSEAEIREVDVDPRFTYEVRVEGRPLVTTLIDIAKRVFEILTECESGQPMPMFASYPIQQPLPGRHLDGSFVKRSR